MDCKQPEECFWQRLQHRAGRRSDVILHGWWRRRDHRIWQRRANAGEIFDKTQHLVQKATQAKNTWECFWLWELVPRSWILQDTKLGFCRQFGSGVLTEDCTYIFGVGSGTHSDPRIRRVGWSAVIIQGVSNCLLQTLECWKLHSERLMNSLKPTGGWVVPLSEGERNAVCRAELMTCVVAAEGTRGNMVYVTDNEILQKRQDRGWPTQRLGQGSNPDLWWRMSRGKEHSRCSGSERTLRLQTSSTRITTGRCGERSGAARSGSRADILGGRVGMAGPTADY